MSSGSGSGHLGHSGLQATQDLLVGTWHVQPQSLHGGPQLSPFSTPTSGVSPGPPSTSFRMLKEAQVLLSLPLS